ncbi:MAG: hypothetical protein IT384_19420 [Deltaproteobacteria bacterium]|nr:hypothetical protein [Deltaproteobacteria bacterium]
MISTLVFTTALVALPPPLCRGRNTQEYNPRLDQAPSERAVAEVQAAYEALCPNSDCGNGAVFKNDTIGMNAVTWVSGVRDGPNTRAKIVYSPRFLDGLAQTFGSGASFGVLAHEVGHHLTAAKAMRSMLDHSWDEELRADYLAGCALARAGRPPDELENALRALASSASPSHPAFNKRNPVVRKGYADCKAHQDHFDRLPEQHPFGIGAVLQAEAKHQGCWRYFYRSIDEVARVGPVAAKRRRSARFESKQACEAAREKVVSANERTAEPCACF